MKKFLIFILIFGSAFVYANWETYGPGINEQIDRFVPTTIQNTFSVTFSAIGTAYSFSSDWIDDRRITIKEFSLNASTDIAARATENPKNDAFSPIFSNFSEIFYGELSFFTKVYALILMILTLLFWSRFVTILWVFVLVFLLLKRLFESFREKRKRSFFDKIGENVSSRNND